jgi:predicted acyl esterase
VLNIGGWYDAFLWSALQHYQGMRQRGGTEHARRNQRLIIGPWSHYYLKYLKCMWELCGTFKLFGSTAQSAEDPNMGDTCYPIVSFSSQPWMKASRSALN